MTKSGSKSELTFEQSAPPDPPEPRLEPGTRIADKYEVRAPLGTGAFAVVYDARDTACDRPVAIKVLHVDAETPRGLIERFRREARLSASVRHPHILEVYETGVLEDGSPYLVMERLQGETLSARIARSPLPLAQVIEVGTQLLLAVEAIGEAGIVHRDIKPENVMLHEVAEGPPTVKLVDFGISKRVAIEPEPRLTSHGALVGTPQYMSPEQIRGEEVDIRTDIYAVGAVLYEALSGKAPHESNNFSELVVAVLGAPVPPIRAARPDCPLELEHVILRALARTPHDRHSSPRAFLDAIEHVASTLWLPRGTLAVLSEREAGAQVVAPKAARSSSIVPAPRPTPPTRPTPPSSGPRTPRRRPLQIAVIVGVLAVVPAFALHVYGEPWLDPPAGAHAQRTHPVPPAGDAPAPADNVLASMPPGTPAAGSEPPRPSTSEPLTAVDDQTASSEAVPKALLPARAGKQAIALPTKPVSPQEPVSQIAPASDHAPAADGEVPREVPRKEAAVDAPVAPAAVPSADAQVVDAQVVRAPTAGQQAADASVAALTLASPSAEPKDAGATGATSEAAVESAPALPDQADVPSQVGVPFVESEASARAGALPRRTHKQIMESALAALVRGRLVEAATRYNEAVRLDPKEPSGFRGLGLVAARLGNHAGARWALSRYLTLAPKAQDAPAIAARIAALPH